MLKSVPCDYELSQRPGALGSSSYGSPGQHLGSSSVPMLEFSPGQVFSDNTDPYLPQQGSIIGPAEPTPSVTPGCELWNFGSADSGPMYIQDDTPAQPAIQNTQLSRRAFESQPTSYLDMSNELLDTILFSQPIPRAQRSFGLRRVRGHQFSLSRQYVLCTLRSYPARILPGKTLPPFIHSQCMVDDPRNSRVGQKILPQPLANCAAIVQMWPVKNDSNSVFIWRAIRMEQERLSSEVCHYEILSSFDLHFRF